MTRINTRDIRRRRPQPRPIFRAFALWSRGGCTNSYNFALNRVHGARGVIQQNSTHLSRPSSTRINPASIEESSNIRRSSLAILRYPSYCYSSTDYSYNYTKINCLLPPLSLSLSLSLKSETRPDRLISGIRFVELRQKEPGDRVRVS